MNNTHVAEPECSPALRQWQQLDGVVYEIRRTGKVINWPAKHGFLNGSEEWVSEPAGSCEEWGYYDGENLVYLLKKGDGVYAIDFEREYKDGRWQNSSRYRPNMKCCVGRYRPTLSECKPDVITKQKNPYKLTPTQP